jgi:hypothetical protein
MGHFLVVANGKALCFALRLELAGDNLGTHQLGLSANLASVLACAADC